MKIVLAALVVFAFVAVGCQDKKPADPKPAVTDISPTAPSYTTPVAVQPVSDTPVVVSSTPAAASSTDAKKASATLGGTYTVKKGDTLFSIAKARYGSGGQWQKIASANPGVNPKTLKVGQTLTLP